MRKQIFKRCFTRFDLGAKFTEDPTSKQNISARRERDRKRKGDGERKRVIFYQVSKVARCENKE